jgi:hypothetical protein
MSEGRAKLKTSTTMMERFYRLKATLFNGSSAGGSGSSGDDDTEEQQQGVWMLGRRFASPQAPLCPDALSAEQFAAGVRRAVWMSYRRDFPVIEDNAQTSDAGWGCMLRTS